MNMAFCMNTLSIGEIAAKNSAQLYYMDIMRSFTEFTIDSDGLRLPS